MVFCLPLTEKDIEFLYKKYDLPWNVQKHCKDVAKVALFLADKLNEKVDRQKLKQACLLHDIGRVVVGLRERGTYDFGDERHEKYSKEILQKEGFEELADIVYKHGYFLPDYSFEKLTIEEKLLATADLITTHEGDINLEKRKKQILDKYEKNKDYKALKRFEKAYEMIIPFLKKLGLIS